MNFRIVHFRILLFLFLIVCQPVAQAQLKFRENTFVGGVSGDGATRPDPATPLTLNMPAGSTVVKAYLFAGEQGIAPTTTVTFNGTNLVFNSSTRVTPQFATITFFGNVASVHAIDVSSLVNASTNTYTITVSPSPLLSAANVYTDFYLYAEYTHPSLTMPVYSAIFLRSEDFGSPMDFNISLGTPLNNTSDAGVALFGGYILNNSNDGEKVFIESTLLGTIGSPVPPAQYDNHGETVGSFYYHNNLLKGIKDDNEDQKMKDADGLSKINALAPNGTSLVNITFEHDPGGDGQDNAIWAVFYVNGTSCKKPIFDLGNAVSTCSNQITLDAGVSGYTYSWNTAATTQQLSVTHSGYYTLTVTDQNGCSARDSVQVNFNSATPLWLGNDTTLLKGSSINLNGQNAASYMWSPPDGLSCVTCSNPVASPNTTTSYVLTITDQNGCINSDTITITVIDEPNCFGDVFLPSAFSPNNDGVNDVFKIWAPCGLSNFSLKIFDRWGELVFETTDTSQGWNGLFKGSQVNTGVYFYTVRGNDPSNDQEFYKKGNVTLVR